MSSRSRHDRRAWVVVMAVVLGTAVWRVLLVQAGPDPDSDAYGHHVIARRLLEQPGQHGAHWVWLPLFHWLQVPLVALGGTMQLVRYANVALWAAVPLALYPVVRGGRRPTPPAIAALAAILAALCPIGMQMGTTAQPEPLFALAVLGFAWSFERRRFVLAASVATAAVLLRYEGWAVVAATGLVLGLRAWRRRSLRGPHGLRPYLSVVLPSAAVLGWALVRWPVDGCLFGFVLDTRDFAHQALSETSAFSMGPGAVARDAVYYVYDVGLRVYRWAILLVPFGVWSLGRRHPWLALSGGACLAFVSLSWLMRGSLGLDRHFVSVIPAYATAMALGAEALGTWTGRLFAAQRRRRASQIAAALLGAAATVQVAHGLDVWMGHWRAAIEGGYRDRQAVAAFVRGLPPSQPIFCDEPTVEVLTGLPHRRFERRSVHQREVRARIAAVAEQRGAAYVVSWVGRLAPLRDRGTILFRPDGAEPGEGLAVLRVDGTM